MFGLTPSVRVFVAAAPVDMRGSFDALAGAVRRLALDPLDGHLYVFMNRRRQLAKVIWFDRTGFCVLAKRLERGTFQLPEIPEGATQVGVDGPTLASLLAGIDFTAARKHWFRGRSQAAQKST